MKTLRLEEPGRVSLIETSAPAAPGPGEAVVSVRRIGVCGTDLHAFAGRQPFFSYPRILGHELGAEVLAVGLGVAEVRPGDLCAVEPYLNCGSCIACRRGKTNCCAALRVLGVHTDGGMCERILMPAKKLHVSSRLSLDQLALVETLGIGCHAVDRGQIEPGETCAVFGAGPIGLSVMQFAREAGARVIALDINAARLEFCRRQLGVAETVNVSEEPAGVALARLTDNDLPTIVFDATGNARSMMAAFDHVSPGGRLVFVGLFQGDITFNDPHFHRRELTILSSRNALSSDFTRIIRLIEEGRIDTTPWITHRATFEEAPTKFASWGRAETGTIKAMIEA